jgi:hypothetical protein
MEIPIMMAEEVDDEISADTRQEPEASVEIAAEAFTTREAAPSESEPPPVPNTGPNTAKAPSTTKDKKKKKKSVRRLTSEIRPPTPEELTGLFKPKDFFKALEDAGLERHIVARK